MKIIVCIGARNGRVSDNLTQVGLVRADSANSTTVQRGPTVVMGGGVDKQTIED